MLCLQIKDLEQRLSKASEEKGLLADRLKASEDSVQSLQAELHTTKTALEAKQTEFKQVQDKVGPPYQQVLANY